MKRAKKAKPAQKPAGKPIHECFCFVATGKREHDLFAPDTAEQASALAMIGACCAPAESAEHIVTGTLEQLARELDVLACLVWSDVDHRDMRALLTGMAERARVALAVDGRIERLPYEVQLRNAGAGRQPEGPSDG